MAPAPGGRTKALYTVITGVLVVVALESICWAAIDLAWPRRAEPIQRTNVIFREQSKHLHQLLYRGAGTMYVFDSVLGWGYRPGYRSDLYTISSQGLRGGAPYAPFPGAGVLRVAAFGDSFVFGIEVDDSSAWPSVIERTFPGIEVPNYGVAAYGLDQAYLAYLARGKDLHPQVVILSFMSDDLGRVVNVYRPFRSNQELPLAKPRFLLEENGALKLVPNPLPRAEDYRSLLRRPRDVLALGQLDYWYMPLVYGDPLYDYSATVRLVTALWIRVYRRYWDRNRLIIGAYMNPSSEAFKTHVALFQHVADSVRTRGAEPLIVFFPDPESLERTMRGARPSYQPLLDTLRAHGLNPLDAVSAFAAQRLGDPERWFMPNGHYSPQGNRVVAVWLGRLLEVRREALRASQRRP